MSTPNAPASPAATPPDAGPIDRPLNRKHVTAWALWDWGSASFNAVMVTFVFATYLASDSFGPDDRGTQWLTAANAIGGIVVALTAPVMGQRSDRGGRRKLWLGINTGVVILLTALCFFVRPDEAYLLLGVVLIAAANVAFEFAGVNYNAMLLQVATPKTIGKVSGIGWGAGYVGGIFLLLILYVGFISGDTHWLGVTNDDAMNIRVVALFSALWFIAFALPLFFSTPEHRGSGEDEKVSLLESYRRLWRTILGLWRDQRNTFWFLASSAVFRDGVGAVFAYGAILGTTVYGVDPADILIFGIAANVVAAAGSFAGGWIDDRIGPKRVIMGSLVGLIVTAGVVFFLNGTTAFWIFGLLLCFFVGPVQSSSRSFLGRLTSEQRAGEIYGLYATTGRAVSFLTPALISVGIALTRDSRYMVPAILLVLIAGMALLVRVRDPKTADAL
ncbi:MFS transporter [Citricoccus zhacaiensis]|uniref:MFS transporter n=1 Tax=Citricoccus zhacaiensis TaxID=489142 RepID=A0ABQ2M7A9_9MICC|nr:MFS transporter [Citricoccus zhacaiensis]GGO47672.1 MFS transporter [Citricoccus zhacaiensis]